MRPDTKEVLRVAYAYYWPVPSRSADTTYVMKMCEGFEKAGYPTTLFAPAAQEISDHDLWQRYAIHTPFKTCLMRPVPGFRRLDIALRSARRIGHMSPGLVIGKHLPALALLARQGNPVILDAHGPPPERMGKYYLRLLFSQRGFRHIVAITQPVKWAYLESFPHYLEPDDILVEPNGVSLEQFDSLPDQMSLRRRLQLPLDAFIAGYVGHLYAGRGIDIILAMAEALPHMQFVIVGGTEADIQRWRDTEWVRRLANVRFSGFVDHTLVPQYLCASDVLLMPYQKQVRVYGSSSADTSAFMSPMKMFEYMATRRPIIASDLPVLREVLNEDNALLCPPDDVRAWVAAIQRACDDPQRAAQQAANARRTVENHTWTLRAQRIVEAALAPRTARG